MLGSPASPAPCGINDTSSLGGMLMDSCSGFLGLAVPLLFLVFAGASQSITADVSTLTGDPNTRNNLKQLIESLSRIVVD